MATAPTRTTDRAPATTRDGPAPRLAEGVELHGLYESSGLKDPPYIARRADGQLVQLAPLLYAFLEEVDGRRGYAEIARRVGARHGREIAPGDAQYLLDEKLRPLGLLALPDGSSPKLEKPDPFLALKLRTAVVPARVTKAITTAFVPFFYPGVIASALAAVGAFDAWLFGVHGIAQPLRHLVYQPALLLMVAALVVVGTALHEIGHAAALRYGGGEPGVMGVGVYVVWPAFYTDVTDAYRLSRRGRLRTDLGGVYFNGLFILAVGAAYYATGFEALLVVALVQHLQVLQNFLPFLRLDGYYILSDLTGVPDMFARIKPTLRSLIPGREPDRRVSELKPWVRAVTTAWVATLVPVLLVLCAMLVFNAPRMFATAWDSLLVQIDRLGGAWSDGSALGIGLAVFQAVALVLPVAGWTYTFSKIGSKILGVSWRWAGDAPVRQGVVFAAAMASGAAAAYILLPNGDYRPIQAAERGTLSGAARQFAHAVGGRPGLTPQREVELGGAPTERELPRLTRRDGASAGDGDPGDDTPTAGTTTGATGATGSTAATGTAGSGTATGTPSSPAATSGTTGTTPTGVVATTDFPTAATTTESAPAATTAATATATAPATTTVETTTDPVTTATASTPSTTTTGATTETTTAATTTTTQTSTTP